MDEFCQIGLMPSSFVYKENLNLSKLFGSNSTKTIIQNLLIFDIVVNRIKIVTRASICWGIDRRR
jgi:hypothetical protein